MSKVERHYSIYSPINRGAVGQGVGVNPALVSVDENENKNENLLHG